MQDDEKRNLWQADHDSMLILLHFFKIGITGNYHSIFSVENSLDDPRYVKLRVTKAFRCKFYQFENVEFLNHAYLFDSNIFIRSEEKATQHHYFMKCTQLRPLTKKYTTTRQVYPRGTWPGL